MLHVFVLCGQFFMLEVVISALSDIIVFWGLRLSKALKQEAQIFVNDWK